MDQPELINSQKGKIVLSFRGFVYHYHSKSKNGQRLYWRCEKRDECVARVTTNADMDNIQVSSVSRKDYHRIRRVEVNE